MVSSLTTSVLTARSIGRRGSWGRQVPAEPSAAGTTAALAAAAASTTAAATATVATAATPDAPSLAERSRAFFTFPAALLLGVVATALTESVFAVAVAPLAWGLALWRLAWTGRMRRHRAWLLFALGTIGFAAEAGIILAIISQ